MIVTGVGAPSHRPARNAKAPTSDGGEEKVEAVAQATAMDAAGYYREPWTPVRQAEWVRKALAIALSKPFVESAVCHELFDHQSAELPGAGLISSLGRPKPALTAASDLHRDLKRRVLRCSLPAERSWVVGPAGEHDDA